MDSILLNSYGSGNHGMHTNTGKEGGAHPVGLSTLIQILLAYGAGIELPAFVA